MVYIEGNEERYIIKKPEDSFLRKVHRSRFILSVDENENIEILKSRYGTINLDFSSCNYIIGKLISKTILQSNNPMLTLFKGSIENEIQEKLEEIIKKYEIKRRDENASI